MRLLLLSDLHCRADWYAWIARQKADLTTIAGDLLDGFHEEGLLPQMVALKKWADAFPGQLAISSRNHDGNIEGGALPGNVFPTIDREATLGILQQSPTLSNENKNLHHAPHSQPWKYSPAGSPQHWGLLGVGHKNLPAEHRRHRTIRLPLPGRCARTYFWTFISRRGEILAFGAPSESPNRQM